MFTLIFLHFHSCLQYFKAFIPEFNNTRTSPSPVLSFHLKQKYTAIIFEHKLYRYEGQKEYTQRRKKGDKGNEGGKKEEMSSKVVTPLFLFFFLNLNFKY